MYNENAIVEVSKEFTFDSCHYLEDYEGNCANLHGHTYKLQVNVKGVIDEKGMVVDFKILKLVVGDVIRELDHNHLNEVLDFNPTAENMSVYLFEKIQDKLNDCIDREVRVSKIKLWETPTSYAEYNGLTKLEDTEYYYN